MSQWGKLDQANNSVIWGTSYVNLTPNANNQTTLYQNVTVGAFKNNNVAMSKAVGQFGVSADEAANTTGEGKKVAHAGWNLRTVGTGPLGTITVSAAGQKYTNNDVVTIVAGVGGANATGNVVTNGALGNVVAVSITSTGSGFTTATPSVVITTANGSGATITATAGGRAGRVQYETLVAMGSQANGTTDDSILPQ